MKNKTVGVTRQIYDLCKALEKRELTLDFSVFYSFAEILESHHFCPGFEFDNQYYEIQYDEFDNLQVLEFPFRGNMDDEGSVLNSQEIDKLTKKIIKLCITNNVYIVARKKS